MLTLLGDADSDEEPSSPDVEFVLIAGLTQTESPLLKMLIRVALLDYVSSDAADSFQGCRRHFLYPCPQFDDDETKYRNYRLRQFLSTIVSAVTIVHLHADQVKLRVLGMAAMRSRYLRADKCLPRFAAEPHHSSPNVVKYLAMRHLYS